MFVRLNNVKGNVATEGEDKVASAAGVYAPVACSQGDGGRHCFGHVKPYLSDYCIGCSHVDLSFQLEVKMSSVSEDGNLGDLQ